jgi:hypothetical protein
MLGFLRRVWDTTCDAERGFPPGEMRGMDEKSLERGPARAAPGRAGLISQRQWQMRVRSALRRSPSH